MFCKNCGKNLGNQITICPSCGSRQGSPIKVKTYLPEAIITTFCCCLPFGIVAIVYAAKCSTLLQNGDMVEAHVTSEKAKMWVVLSFISGIAISIIYALLELLLGISYY